MSRRLIVLGLSVVSLPATAGAQRHVNGAGFDPAPLEIPVVPKAPPRPISSMDLLTIRDLYGVRISPDGKSVAFVAGQAIYETNSYRSGLFVVATAPGSAPVSLGTAGPPRWDDINQWLPDAPQWSPDSRYLTLRLHTDGAWQVWRWNRDGSHPVQLTHARYDVQRFDWSPDGRQITFVVRLPRDSMEAKHLQEHGIRYTGHSEPWALRSVVDEQLASEPDRDEDWTYDIATGTEQRTPAEQQPGTDEWQRRLEQQLGDYIANDKNVRNGRLGHILYPKLSPDGKKVVYGLYLDDPAKSARSAYPLYVKALDGSPAVALTPGAYYIGDYSWSRDGREIYFVEYAGNGRAPVLSVVSASGGSRRRLVASPPGEWVAEFSLDSVGRYAAAVHETNTTPSEVVLLDVKTGARRTLANVNPEFGNLQLSPATRLEWTPPYGQREHGYLVKPLQYVAGRRYPLVVTTYRAGDEFLRGGVGDEYPIQVFAANGFAVLAFDAGESPNHTPGDFEGQMAHWRWPMASLGAALQLLDSMGIVDSTRRALTGLSFGSEITEFTISHSHLFQVAIVSGGGSRDPYFYYMSNATWHHLFADWGLGGWPEGAASQNWHALAPVLNADHITAPLLSNAAETEYIVGLSLVAALEALHKPMELFIYPNELHVKNQPKHRYEIYERNVDWLKFWLQGMEDPDPAKQDQYARWRAMRAQRDP